MNSYNWIIIFTICLVIGVGFGCTFGAIVHAIRKKKDENATFINCTSSLILPSIMFCMAIGFIIAIIIQYQFPIELLILSTLIVTGLFSSIETKNAWPFFILLGIVVIYLPAKPASVWLYDNTIQKFIKWLHKKPSISVNDITNNNL